MNRQTNFIYTSEKPALLAVWCAVVTKVSALKTYVVDFKNESEYVIRLKRFLVVPFLTFLALYTKVKRCGQMGPTPCYSQSQVASACQSFRPVAPFFFLAKV